MECEASQSKTSTLQDFFYLTLSLEGQPTKAKEAPSPHEVRLAPTRHQSSISMPGV